MPPPYVIMYASVC